MPVGEGANEQWTPSGKMYRKKNIPFTYLNVMRKVLGFRLSI